MAYRSIEKKRANARVYNATHKEENKRRHREYYLKNRQAIILRTKRYHKKNVVWKKKYYKGYYEKIRLEVLARVDPAMKCALCGCDDTRFLEVNHIKGGGKKEQRGYKEEGHNLGHNMILLIHTGKRGLEDLNLLCRACNSIDHLERVYGHSGLRVVWDKPIKNLKYKVVKGKLVIEKE